jgi:hypothetical protein
MKIIAQLRQRRVIKTTSIYLGAGWMLIGAADIFFSIVGINPGLLETMIWVLVGCIPLVVLLSWFLQANLDSVEKKSATTQRQSIDLVVITLLVGALFGSIYFQLNNDGLLLHEAPLVAVVPFDDLSEVGSHVTHGLADELINLMIREPQLRLVNFGLASAITLTGLDLLGAVREMKADFIVRGSVRVHGRRLARPASGDRRSVWTSDMVRSNFWIA